MIRLRLKAEVGEPPVAADHRQRIRLGACISLQDVLHQITHASLRGAPPASSSQPMTRAGLPDTLEPAGTHFVTTEPAVTTAPGPTTTPGIRVTEHPIQAPSEIVTERALRSPQRRSGGPTK